MDFSGWSFGSLVEYIYNNAFVKAALGLVLADVLSGIAVAIKSGDFRLGRTADFLRTKAIPYFLGAGALQLVIVTLPPEWSGVSTAAGAAVWLFVVAALVGHLLDNLRELGLPVPDMLTAKRHVPLVLLPLLLASALGASACAGRYVPDTTPQAAFAYEMREALKPIRQAQKDLIAAVDEGRTTAAIADRFLSPAAYVFRFTQEQITPRLRVLDAAYSLGDTARAAVVKGELGPLLLEWNSLVGRLFRVQLPAGLLGSVITLADEVRKALNATRTEFGLTF